MSISGNVSLKLPADKASNPTLQEYANKEVIIGIRPECLHEDPEDITKFADASFDAYVDVTELMGAENISLSCYR